MRARVRRHTHARARGHPQMEICRDGMTIRAFCKRVQRVYDRTPGDVLFLNHTTFTQMFHVWLGSLVIPRPLRCHLCETTPRVLICDGTGVNIQTRHLHPHFRPITAVDDDLKGVEWPRHGHRHTRCLFPELVDRAAARKLAGISPEPGDPAPAVFKQETLQRMIDAAPAAGPFIKWVADFRLRRDEATGNHELPPLARGEVDFGRRCALRVLDAASRNSPTNSLVSPALAHLIAQHTRESFIAAALNHHGDCFRDLLLLWTTTADGGVVKAEVWALLCALSTQTLSNCNTGAVPQHAPTPQPRPPPIHRGDDYTFGEPVRRRPSFAMDSASKTVEEKRDPLCTHQFGHARKKTGGVFTFFCQHGFCWGFHIIEVSSSF